MLNIVISDGLASGLSGSNDEVAVGGRTHVVEGGVLSSPSTQIDGDGER